MRILQLGEATPFGRKCLPCAAKVSNRDTRVVLDHCAMRMSYLAEVWQPISGALSRLSAPAFALYAGMRPTVLVFLHCVQGQTKILASIKR